MWHQAKFPRPAAPIKASVGPLHTRHDWKPLFAPFRLEEWLSSLTSLYQDLLNTPWKCPLLLYALACGFENLSFKTLKEITNIRIPPHKAIAK